MAFTQWQTWPDGPKFNKRTLAEILDGGQTFRWNEKTDFFEGRWGGNVLRLRINKSSIEFAAPKEIESAQAVEALNHYLATESDFEALTDALPWRSDPILKTAIEAFPGLRILRQPLDETLFCFLCSSTKQIPQIKAICEAIADDLGETLADGSKALPSWRRIAEVGETRLRAAKLGYRAKYIHQTALFLADHPNYLEKIEASSTEDARDLLMQLPGVGRKIADCVLLFGAARLEAFPIDTWVQKILSRAYGLNDWKTGQLLEFAHAHFGTSAGLAQQYLFAAARAGIIAK
ncbi:MAG: DNA glycosylase [Verrucomicrobiota bacterium]